MSSAGLGELQIRPERTRRVERAKEAPRRWAFASLSMLAARVGNERETEPDESGGVQPACVRGGGELVHVLLVAIGVFQHSVISRQQARIYTACQASP